MSLMLRQRCVYFQGELAFSDESESNVNSYQRRLVVGRTEMNVAGPWGIVIGGVPQYDPLSGYALPVNTSAVFAHQILLEAPRPQLSKSVYCTNEPKPQQRS